MFLQILVEDNPRKRIEYKYILFYSYTMVGWSIFYEKEMQLHTKKCKYTPKMIKMILNIYAICNMYFHMRFQIILNYICEPLEELDKFCITNGGFKRLLTIILW